MENSSNTLLIDGKPAIYSRIAKLLAIIFICVIFAAGCKKTGTVSLSPSLAPTAQVTEGGHPSVPTFTPPPTIIPPPTSVPTFTPTPTSVPTLTPTPTASPTPTTLPPTPTAQVTEVAPTPIPDAPIIAVIDHYTMPPDIRASMSNEQIQRYRALVDDVIAGETQIALSGSYSDNLLNIQILQKNPLYYLLSSYSYPMDGKSLSIEYAFGVDERQAIIAKIDSEYLDILNTEIQPWYNDVEKALAMYRYFSERISYNHAWEEAHNAAKDPESIPDIGIYEALDTNLGVCHTYSYLFEYAMLQLGIDCFTLHAVTSYSDEAHAWNLVKLDGSFYFCDLTWQSGPDADGLRYFGITDEERRSSGITGYSLDTFQPQYGNVSCNNDSLYPLRHVTAFEINENHMLDIEMMDGTVGTFDTEISGQEIV